MTPRHFACAALASLMLAGSTVAAPLKSGPQVGTENDRSGFRPKWVTGPATGQRRCPV